MHGSCKTHIDINHIFQFWLLLDRPVGGEGVPGAAEAAAAAGAALCLPPSNIRKPLRLRPLRHRPQVRGNKV